MNTHRFFTWFLVFCLLLPALPVQAQETPDAPAQVQAYISVNSPGDEGDADTGDGICGTTGKRSPEMPGMGEGEIWLVGQNVTTDSRGNGLFTVALPGPLPAGYAVAGTLTDPDGNTSEFQYFKILTRRREEREENHLQLRGIAPSRETKS